MFNDEKIIQLKKEGKTWNDLGEIYNCSPDKVRNYARSKKWYKDIRNINPQNKKKETEVLQSKTNLSDGSISSFIRQQLSEQKTFTEKELLELHGFNSDEFQIKTVTSNEWSMTNGDGEKYYNFQSKIIAEKVKAEYVALDKFNEILDKINPLQTINQSSQIRSDYLLIPLYDMHFGLNSYNDYFELLGNIQQLVSKGYKEILIIVGGDYTHSDNMKSQTVKGTQLETVNFEKMIEDAERFLLDLTHQCSLYSNNIKIVYLPGNHAESIDYLIVRSIEKLMPNVTVDYKVEEYKHSWLGTHSIFSHHGDKRATSSKLLEVLVSKYAKEWGNSQSRYLITGHRHHETSLSNAGMTHYQVMSPSKSTEYEERSGYISSEKGMQIFEFDEIKRKAVYYL